MPGDGQFMYRVTVSRSVPGSGSRGSDELRSPGRRRHSRTGALTILTALAAAAILLLPGCARHGAESRFSVPLPIANGNPNFVGSITMAGRQGSSRVTYENERPGDGVGYGIGPIAGMGMGGLHPLVATGVGSEIRFLGTVEGKGWTIMAARGGRLVFRKIEGDRWAYVSGLGSYQSHGRLTRLGYDRTEASCLRLLKSKDPVLREGAARDLGRLTTARDAGLVVTRLEPLLADSSAAVRRGAIEGLGLIGTSVGTPPTAYELLLNAYSWDDPAKLTTRDKFILEALGFCAAYSLLGEPYAKAKPASLGEAYLLTLYGAKGRWFADNLSRRIAAHRNRAMTALARAEKSSDQITAKAARIVAGLLSGSGSGGSSAVQ